ncbi:MAG TPA: hypothetical protein VMZ71_02490, partial [Gemmataceae bacterium]|nr:hypothetical protein [Gemmataceae bacterium]
MLLNRRRNEQSPLSAAGRVLGARRRLRAQPAVLLIALLLVIAVVGSDDLSALLDHGRVVLLPRRHPVLREHVLVRPLNNRLRELQSLLL